MSSALQLNATSVIINGQGLAANTAVLSAISTFKSQTPIALLANCFSSANLNSNVANTVIPILDTIGSGVSQATFLLDIYPSNITPISSTGVVYTGNGLPSAAGTIQAQVLAPFNHGIPGFANVFSTCNGYSSQVFETVSSINLLKTKTYGQSGIGYTNTTDLATGGIGVNGALIASVIQNWGTMYDITKINLIDDPYVFGQNLLNQGFGTIGGLSDQLTQAGLDVSDITKIPSTVTTTTQQSSSLTYTSSVGAVDLPFLSNVTTTNTVTGSSVDVILSIYGNITGANLTAITSAANIIISSNQITTLADYLNFDKIVDATTAGNLTALGITDFSSLANYLHGRLGQGRFSSWHDLAETLKSIDVPTTTYTPASTGASSVLSSSAITTLLSGTGSGTGPFGNPVLPDYLSATSGIGYIGWFNTINSNYASLSGTVQTAMVKLDRAVADVYNTYIATGGDGTGESAPGAGDGTAPGTLHPEWVTSNVALVNAVMTGLSSSTTLTQSQTAYYNMLNQLSLEVSNLQKAGATFGTGFPTSSLNFAQNITGYARDKTRTLSYQIFANIITNDAAGDTIRAAISESINIQKLSGAGIQVTNDPNPELLLASAQAKNIPLTTYITQNQ